MYEFSSIFKHLRISSLKAEQKHDLNLNKEPVKWEPIWSYVLAYILFLRNIETLK